MNLLQSSLMLSENTNQQNQQALFHLWKGEALLDGENIKNLKLEWLMSQIGLVTQEPALLSLSIKDNIAYGRDATSLQIEDAAKTAHAHTFISSLVKGYDTHKIRLSVARAVLLNPCILFLDEVTGGLDFEAERSVQEALDLLMLGRSTIIIARRLLLIKNADFIAVMEEGQLMEIRTHDELIASDGLYAELLICEEAAKLPKSLLLMICLQEPTTRPQHSKSKKIPPYKNHHLPNLPNRPHFSEPLTYTQQDLQIPITTHTDLQKNNGKWNRKIIDSEVNKSMGLDLNNKMGYECHNS
uniref:ABC transporter domain-containing protein n=1 Tax=Lactuca sativa TaxID=4236 RepID=A0A9R1W2T5_LACSA|nr:hypothetical protein LSAT_V11C300155360 [Lactuca sativa]